MKRYEIRRQLPLQISDAQLRRTIAGLGLPIHDSHDYSADDAQRIVAQFNSGDSGGGGATQSNEPPVQLQAVAQNKIRSSTQQNLENVRHFIETTSDQRDQTLEVVSDTLAGLLCPQRFTAEALQRTANKLSQPTAISPLFYDAGLFLGAGSSPSSPSLLEAGSSAGD